MTKELKQGDKITANGFGAEFIAWEDKEAGTIWARPYRSNIYAYAYKKHEWRIPQLIPDHVRAKLKQAIDDGMDLKFRIESEEQSKELQELLHEYGCSWYESSDTVMYIQEKVITVENKILHFGFTIDNVRPKIEFSLKTGELIEPDPHEDFPNIEFVQIIPQRNGEMYFNYQGNTWQIHKAPTNKKFAGFGYKLPDGNITVISLLIIYWNDVLKDWSREYTSHYNQPIRPTWVCFLKNETEGE